MADHARHGLTAASSVHLKGREFMPLLTSRYGYFVILVLIAAVCVSLYRLFLRSGWL